MNLRTNPKAPRTNRRVLKALREAREPVASRFAARVGISPGALYDIEHGRRNGSRETLERIAVELRVDLDVITHESAA